MIQGNHIVQFSDIAYDDYMRLQDEEIRELQDQMNCNNCDDNGEAWFDKEEITHIEVIDEDEFFERFCSAM